MKGKMANMMDMFGKLSYMFAFNEKHSDNYLTKMIMINCFLCILNVC